MPRELFRPVKLKCADGSMEVYYVYERAVTLVKHHQRVKLFITYEDWMGSPHSSARIAWTGGRARPLRRYAKRWRVETLYRDTKQNLGLESYESRKI